jgi:hypothetical protein
MTKKRNHERDEGRVSDFEADLMYHAAVTSALAERVSAFSNRLASEGLDGNSIRTLAQEVVTLQGALPRALMKLNNAAVAEYEARR